MLKYPDKIFHWINDKEVSGDSGKFFDKYDPATGAVLTRVAIGEKKETDTALAAAEKAYSGWSQTNVSKRAEILQKVVSRLNERKGELAEIVAIESGKPRKISIGEVEGAIKCGRFFADEGAKLFGTKEILTSAVPGRKVELRRQPIGVGVLITPFNNSAAGIAWKLFVALLCGNAVVIKSHSYTPFIAIWYAKLLKEVGLPSGVVNVLQGGGGNVGAALVSDQRVKFVSLTGSLATGASILKNTADRLAKVSIEAGGKNPFVVCDDADLERAATFAVESAFVDGGQRCAAASRIIIFESVYEKFKKLFIEKASKLKVGVGDDCDYGAIISLERMGQILKYANDAVKNGAKLTLGNPVAKSEKGYFIEPIVLENVKIIDPIWREEVFGPVVVLAKAKDFEDALRLANDSDFKLSGAIHTKDLKRAEDFIKRYISGVTRVNGPTHGSEPHMPFGGVGMSGNGWREPGSKALDFYADWKQVSIDN